MAGSGASRRNSRKRRISRGPSSGSQAITGPPRRTAWPASRTAAAVRGRGRGSGRNHRPRRAACSARSTPPATSARPRPRRTARPRRRGSRAPAPASGSKPAGGSMGEGRDRGGEEGQRQEGHQAARDQRLERRERRREVHRRRRAPARWCRCRSGRSPPAPPHSARRRPARRRRPRGEAAMASSIADHAAARSASRCRRRRPCRNRPGGTHRPTPCPARTRAPGASTAAVSPATTARRPAIPAPPGLGPQRPRRRLDAGRQAAQDWRPSRTEHVMTAAETIARLLADPRFQAAVATMDARARPHRRRHRHPDRDPRPALQGGAPRRRLSGDAARPGLRTWRRTRSATSWACAAAPATASTVVVAAHLDTVFPEGTDVKVRREGTKLFAPGVGDDTRSLAVHARLPPRHGRRQDQDQQRHPVRRRCRRGRARRPARRALPVRGGPVQGPHRRPSSPWTARTWTGS